MESSKRPACDNRKDRKTKCDRNSPCSSCIASKLDCRITRRAPEKRQRILISARYDEAMESVDRSLQDVLQALQKLLQKGEQPQELSKGSPVTSISSHLLKSSGISEGYRGDSSFKAHVQRVTDTLRDAATDLEFNISDSNISSTMSATKMIRDAANSEETTPSMDETPSSSSQTQTQYPELESRPLPPLDTVLKLLRLTKTEIQRFFMDVPVVDEHEFGELCQKVYFAINEYSLSACAIVNTGLYYLFTDLKASNYSQIGVTSSDIQVSSQLLSANIEAAIESLRLCQDPSMEGCQALSLMATFYMKSGRSAIGWSLIASAARMCIDLGWHRLPPNPKEPEILKQRTIFWHIYVMEKGMAFNFGRTPSIHQYDVATDRPSFKDLPGAPERLYAAAVEFAVIVGDMHIQLFSATAQRASQQTRTESAKAFAARMIQLNSDFKQLPDEPPLDTMFQPTTLLLDIHMHCLITIVYRTIPCDGVNSHPLQCNFECIEAARKALSTIVQARQVWGQRYPTGWSRFLNMLFSMVPFSCFVVLAGNTVASSSIEDLELLAAAIAAIEPIAANSPSGSKLYDVCKSFYQAASISVDRQTAISRAPPYPSATTSVAFDRPAEIVLSGQLNNLAPTPYEHIMAPQDWDTIMNEFDLEIGAGEVASFVEPYIPFDGRML